jgi:hypothetical protein
MIKVRNARDLLPYETYLKSYAAFWPIKLVLPIREAKIIDTTFHSEANTTKMPQKAK